MCCWTTRAQAVLRPCEARCWPSWRRPAGGREAHASRATTQVSNPASRSRRRCGCVATGRRADGTLRGSTAASAHVHDSLVRLAATAASRRADRSNEAVTDATAARFCAPRGASRARSPGSHSPGGRHAPCPAPEGRVRRRGSSRRGAWRWRVGGARSRRAVCAGAPRGSLATVLCWNWVAPCSGCRAKGGGAEQAAAAPLPP